MKKESFKNENVLILGASKGLGLELSKITFDQGATNLKIASSYHDGEIERKKFFHCDLSELKSTLAVCQKLEKYQIDRFFWVAGIFLQGDLMNHSDQDVLKTIDVNLRNPILIAKTIWAKMQRGEGKSFTVISSSSGITPREDQAIYVTTKFAQIGFTRSLGLENKKDDLKVSLFLPGGMKTPFYKKRPFDFDQFLEPSKVATKIIDEVINQKDKFIEVKIPRGSL